MTSIDMNFLFLNFFSIKYFIFTSLICLILILITFRLRRNSIPGPNIFKSVTILFAPSVFKYLNNLSKQYGPILEFPLLAQKLIILSNYEFLKEAFIKNGEHLSDRPRTNGFKVFSDFKGIAFTNGEFWKEQRKFTMNYLLKFGFQESIDNIILEEIDFVCNEINKNIGKNYNPRPVLVKFSNNIIMRLTTSERSDYDEPADFIQENVGEVNKGLRMLNPINIFEPLKYILQSHKKYNQSVQNIGGLLMDIIKKHEDSFDGEVIRDFVDAFLLKMYEDNKLGNTKSTYTKEQLMKTLLDFFVAGSDTISATVLWAMLYLLYHPDVQDKIHEEIDSVVGCSRHLAMSDCTKLNYTYATVLETQRLANVSPLGLPRQATSNFNLHGYDIPKGSFIVANLAAMHFDPNHWKDPHKFDPTRFLDNNQNLIRNITSFWPLGTGTRVCVGESLTRKELFLMFASLLQRYTLKATPKLPVMNDCKDSLVLQPLPFDVCFIQR